MATRFWNVVYRGQRLGTLEAPDAITALRNARGIEPGLRADRFTVFETMPCPQVSA